jgi:chromate transporter
VDIPTALIAMASVGALLYFKKMNEPYIIGLAAIIGIIIKAL